MRAIIQEKLRNKVTKDPENNLGQIALFFGTRTSNDLLFKGDLETAARLGALSNLKISFSRQPVILGIKIESQETVYPGTDLPQ